jgi:hypothetical protein
MLIEGPFKVLIEATGQRRSSRGKGLTLMDAIRLAMLPGSNRIRSRAMQTIYGTECPAPGPPDRT